MATDLSCGHILDLDLNTAEAADLSPGCKLDLDLNVTVTADQATTTN